MASCSSLLSEEQFLCSVCLDVFSQPVSTPCGHNFCKACITAYWDDAAVCQCPLCKTVFERRPDLRVNTFISGLAAQFMSLQLTDAGSWSLDRQQAKSGNALCDICTDAKLEAVKSCLECLTSYCGTHLEPHQRVAGLKRHTLMDPAESLEDKICKEHNRLLALFCRTDEVVLCDICAGSRHVTHDTVPVQQEYREKKAQAGRAEAKVQQMIQERLQKVREIKEAVKLSQKVTANEVANSVRDFTALVSELQKSQAELVMVMEERQKAAERQADDLIKDMEQEITELQRTNKKLRDLIHTEDYLRLLQNFPSQFLLPHTMDWSAVSFNSHLGTEHMRKSLTRSMSQLQLTLTKMSMEIKKFCDDAEMLSDAALWRVQQHEVDIVLDPNTAHPVLILSDDGKQVRYSTTIQRLPTNSKMFVEHLAVLGKRGFSSGKFYFEVHVGRKMEWSLGVATESVNRKRAIERSLHCGLWALCFIVDRYETFSSPNVPVHWGKVERVGVFVDYEEGHISFYDVEASTLIYSFTDCIFSERLYPYFNPCDDEYGSNLAPLVIVPVSESE
ncbi:E3 ubiquitin-protein ligase TRIM21-like [Centroberyx gerrardi]